MIWGLLFIVSQRIKIWKEQIRPLYYDQVQRRRVRNRQRFAEYNRQEIWQLNNREDWIDDRFTELEDEVEAEGKRLRALPLPCLHSTRRGLRREETLSKALELGLPQFYGQVSRRHKHYFITLCLALLKGNWSRIADGGMEAFPIVVSFYPHPEIV